jgi:hypothetical protein
MSKSEKELIIKNQALTPIKQIKENLIKELGPVFDLIEEKKREGYFPHRLLVRALFPVVESLADLLSEKTDRTSMNLYEFIRDYMSKVRPGYKNCAALLVKNFRHTFIHQDTMKVLFRRSASGEQFMISWSLGYDHENLHLNPWMVDNNHLKIDLQLRYFYHDIISTCDYLCENLTDEESEIIHKKWFNQAVEVLSGKLNNLEHRMLKEAECFINNERRRKSQ